MGDSALSRSKRARRPAEKYEPPVERPKPKKAKAEREEGYYEKLWPVREIKDLKVEKGARRWLVAWDGEDDDGNAWADSWEPTRNVTADAIAEWMADGKEKALRSITVDTRPLDTWVQHEMWQRFSAVPTDTFGHELAFSIGALSLRDVAHHYLTTISKQYGVQLADEYDPKAKEVTYEVRITDPASISEFCSFQQFSSRAKGALRFRGRRMTDVDMEIVGVLHLRYVTDKAVRNCVTFEVEIHTAYINGATGSIQPPHQDDGAFLKFTSHRNALITHARELTPDHHPLVKRGWRDLPPHVHAIP
mmetsp:Transcript_36910/g.97650  ORF Transcript_36910/g.97650 Transcript_36910/m.97650 type:complete len:305 (-) Transcript_36910:265-1179(-)|eukprot:CAMPEP_0115888904 /NCGR_PEP_ID=MMETSP0287-20121206/32547_1 /TAXON_ID=412157 /ORGANISM="Chrysochromulina rotalis, Strain UIO044" /LENGTH=304 /DNA_ID=CAMNT_0003345601 /DNA_START=342 /DNA_END=1256 /DNA_ORIENTATION=-